MNNEELARAFLNTAGDGISRDPAIVRNMLSVIQTAGLEHPTVVAWLANRKKIKAAASTADALTFVLKGADLWQAVIKRAKRVNASRKAAETRKRCSRG